MSDSAAKHARESEYYAWSRGMQSTAEELAKLGVQTAPREVAPETTTPVATPGGSAWNAAGTWEERDISKRAREALTEALTALRSPFSLDGVAHTFVVPEVSECTGSATLVSVRGKVRLGFEMQLKAKWELRGADSESASGTLHVEDLSDDCGGDYDVSFRVTKGRLADPSPAFRAWKAVLCECVGAWVDRMRSWS